jgi:hypothetical protein
MLPSPIYRKIVARSLCFAVPPLLQAYPESGSVVREPLDSKCRQIGESPRRIFYGIDGEKIYVLPVMRGEMQLRIPRLAR